MTNKIKEAYTTGLKKYCGPSLFSFPGPCSGISFPSFTAVTHTGQPTNHKACASHAPRHYRSEPRSHPAFEIPASSIKPVDERGTSTKPSHWRDGRTVICPRFAARLRSAGMRYTLLKCQRDRPPTRAVRDRLRKNRLQ